MFKFHSPSPAGNVCPLHDCEMETILGEPKPTTFRRADGTEETHETQSVLGYRHQLKGGEGEGVCEYWHGWRSPRVTRPLHSLWHGRTVRCVWSIVDGTPQWDLSDPVTGESLATASGYMHTLCPTAPADMLNAYVLRILEDGVPTWTTPPYDTPENPYQAAVLRLRDALIHRGALYLPLGEDDDGFEVNSVVRALELDLFEANSLYGRSDLFLQGVADENEEDIARAIERSRERYGLADAHDALNDVMQTAQMIRIFGENLIVLPMAAVLRLARHSTLGEAIQVSIEESEVMLALAHHGHYDPASGHQPPAGQELDAIEKREQFHDMWDTAFPGIPGLFRWRERPEEGEADGSGL